MKKETKIKAEGGYMMIPAPSKQGLDCWFLSVLVPRRKSLSQQPWPKCIIIPVTDILVFFKCPRTFSLQVGTREGSGPSSSPRAKSDEHIMVQAGAALLPISRLSTAMIGYYGQSKMDEAKPCHSIAVCPPRYEPARCLLVCWAFLLG